MHDSLPDASAAGFRLVRRLGQGAQSQVFLAERLADARQVALKLSPLGPLEDTAAARQAFLQAAGIAQRLVHPDIVAVLDAGIEGATAWLAMEAVPGTDLGVHTRAPQLLQPSRVIAVAQRVAGALSHAHRQGVVHRDLKAGNVLVDAPTDTVKLADFGLARAAGAGQTGTGIVLGTPACMAPEQLAGALPTAATDLYALGVLMFELLSGRLPHEARTMGELLRQVAQDPAPPLDALRPGLPPALALLVARLLAKKPAERPGDAASVAAELRRLSS